MFMGANYSTGAVFRGPFSTRHRPCTVSEEEEEGSLTLCHGVHRKKHAAGSVCELFARTPASVQTVVCDSCRQSTAASEPE